MEKIEIDYKQNIYNYQFKFMVLGGKSSGKSTFCVNFTQK
jgi:polynucleotide 5'-kinase involved in rRNA processing